MNFEKDNYTIYVSTENPKMWRSVIFDRTNDKYYETLIDSYNNPLLASRGDINKFHMFFITNIDGCSIENSGESLKVTMRFIYENFINDAVEINYAVKNVEEKEIINFQKKEIENLKNKVNELTKENRLLRGHITKQAMTIHIYERYADD